MVGGVRGSFYNGGQIIESCMPSTLAQVEPGSFLTLHYRLSGPAGDIINTFGGKPATLSLGTGELSPAVEQCLLGLPEGEHATFELPAGAAFGPRNADMVQWVARKLLRELGDPHETYRVGDVVQFPTPNGQGSYAGAVVQVGQGNSGDNAAGADDGVQFDFNHPLAGQPVTFEVHLIGVL
jgi:FKBP-type peptidyl-prolyl cis-trans isomerase SlpA